MHVAAAINCPFLVISNARFYKRFQPYKGFEKFYIYPPKFKELLNNNKNVGYYYLKTDLNINDISTKDLITKIDDILKQQ